MEQRKKLEQLQAMLMVVKLELERIKEVTLGEEKKPKRERPRHLKIIKVN